MNAKELRELDACIAEHVMGWHQEDVKPSKWFPDGWKNAWINPKGGVTYLRSYTTDPAAAMAVLEKCAGLQSVKVWHSVVHKQWACADDGCYETQYADTLPIAIALFAKKLFSK